MSVTHQLEKAEVMAKLESLAKICAIAAGLLLTVITLLTCSSLLGRNTIGFTLPGDFELTGVVAGAAVALFMPYCQLNRGNIIVDFFTASQSLARQTALDRFGALLLALVFGLIAWRTTLGGLNSFSTNSETQILGFPEWLAYAAMVPPFILTSVIGLHQAVFGAAHADQPPGHDEPPALPQTSEAPEVSEAASRSHP